MRPLLSILLPLCLSMHVYAVQNVVCTSSKKPDVKVLVTFYKDIDPVRPFIGSYNWGATLTIVKDNSPKVYENRTLRITPEVYYSDINLRGDTEGVHLRLYPLFDNNNIFKNYKGQLFINDLDHKVYYNFIDRDGVPGLACL